MELLNFTGSLVKKATNLLGLNSPESPKTAPLDGEIIYCKNNVCVQPPAVLSKGAVPGYLNIRSQEDEVCTFFYNLSRCYIDCMNLFS